MKNKALYSIFFLLMFCVHQVLAQKDQNMTVSSIVEDMNGNPVENAGIYSDPVYTRSKADGSFSITISQNASIRIEAKGYQIVTLSAADVKNMPKIALITDEDILYNNRRKVELPFHKSYIGDVVGAVSYVNVDEIQQYDQRNLADGLLSNRTLGLMGTSQIRGLGVNFNLGNQMTVSYSGAQSLIIVDGIPRDYNWLRTTEIETITVLKDANASVLYGTAAVNGVVLITTKRGTAYKKQADFRVNYGINTPMALPKFLNSADYMEYYNRARANDGLTATYTATDIENYRTGDKIRYPDVDYFSSDYLKPSYSVFDAEGIFSGGNNVAKYFADFSLNTGNDILKIGEGGDTRDYTFTTRLNGDLRINDWINTELDGRAVFYSEQRPRFSSGDWWTDARAIRPFEYTPLLPIDRIDPNNEYLLSAKRIIDGKYLLGGSNARQTHPIGSLYGAGNSKYEQRYFSFDNRINFDLGRWIKGLSLQTSISFDFLTRFSTTVANSYCTYAPVWDTDNKITSLTRYNTDDRATSPLIEGILLTRRFGFYASMQYDRLFGDKHHITGNLLGFGNTYKQSADLQGTKSAHLGLRLGYIYDRRYMIDFSSALVNSNKMAPGHRGGFSPTVGLAWVMSSEDFMSSASFIDYLKLRVSAGIIKSDLIASTDTRPGYYWYDDNLGTSTSWANGDGRSSVASVLFNRGKNFNMTFARRKDVNIGFESLFLGYKLGVEANYFRTTNEGMLVRPTSSYPSWMSTFAPYENYEDVKYQGFEVGVNYTEKWNDLSFRIGANLLYSVSEKTKVHELPNFPHLSRVGQPHDGYWGLECLGFFDSDAEAASSLQAFGGTLKQGDLKYKAQKDNGRIDDDDQVCIGRWQTPWSGNLNFTLSYQRLSVFVLGYFSSGGNGFKESNYFWLQETRKYSDVALKTWTPETRNTAAYPRLTSLASQNNNRRSTFWLYKTDEFRISRIQLTYQMPEMLNKILHLKNWTVYAYMTNPLILAKDKEMKTVATGNSSTLNYRSYAFGLNVSF